MSAVAGLTERLAVFDAASSRMPAENGSGARILEAVGSRKAAKQGRQVILEVFDNTRDNI